MDYKLLVMFDIIAKGSLSGLYDEAKVNELENKEELTGKEIKKLEEYQNNKVVYDAIIEALNKGISDTVYKNPTDFLPVLTNVLSTAITDKKLIEKISDGLSEMDKTADIQRNKKGNILCYYYHYRGIAGHFIYQLCQITTG